MTRQRLRDRFESIDASLPTAYRAFATFLNLGYVPNGAPQRARGGLALPKLNAASTRLLFEVIGSCSLDGRAVVEVGAGRGGNLAAIQRHYGPRVLVGADLLFGNTRFCVEHHDIGSGGFITADSEALPLQSAAVDVVINIESSHYYPNRRSFFAEVQRVLAGGGDFLYADILPVDEFERAKTSLASLGLAIVRDDDITANVVLSCEEIGRRRAAGRGGGLYDTFVVVPGSPEFDALASGRTPYRILALTKPL
jgi:SAM-dependent methyltransferase